MINLFQTEVKNLRTEYRSYIYSADSVPGVQFIQIRRFQRPDVVADRYAAVSAGYGVDRIVVPRIRTCIGGIQAGRPDA